MSQDLRTELALAEHQNDHERASVIRSLLHFSQGVSIDTDDLWQWPVVITDINPLCIFAKIRDNKLFITIECSWEPNRQDILEELLHGRKVRTLQPDGSEHVHTFELNRLACPFQQGEHLFSFDQ